MPKQGACAGECGRLVYLSRGSLPAGQAMCRACRAASGPSRTISLTCVQCGTEFIRKRSDQRPAARPFCSVACHNQGKGPTRHRICEACEAPYHATYPAQRTCGRECGKKIHRPRERQIWPSCRIFARYCRQCGQAFTARQERPTCSKLCADRLYYALHRRRPPMRECIACGAAVSIRRKKCDPCLATSRGDARRRDKHRRRALKWGVASERYTLTEIAKRDRFRCGICRERVDMALKGPHAMCPSIDHVLPLSRGGDDTRANVQLTHWLCNVIKSDRGGGEQLALVG